MSETQQPSERSDATPPHSDHKPGQVTSAKIHRVCIGCNNMFEVTIENYEVKHCPVCRKE